MQVVETMEDSPLLKLGIPQTFMNMIEPIQEAPLMMMIGVNGLILLRKQEEVVKKQKIENSMIMALS